jgi:hypothetical protein
MMRKGSKALDTPERERMLRLSFDTDKGCPADAGTGGQLAQA